MNNWIFLILQTAVSYSLLKFLPLKTDKASVLAFISMAPLWLFISYQNLPKNMEIWKNKLMFLFFLGYGLNIFIFIIFMTVVTFISASTGAELKTLYDYGFPILIFLSSFVALTFHAKEKHRLQTFGLDYHSRIQFEDENTAGSHFSMDETLKALTILNLDPDVKMSDLRNRYMSLAQLYHPDRLAGMDKAQKDNAEEEFKRIQSAYEIVKASIKNNRI